MPKTIETRDAPDSRIASVTRICAAPGDSRPASRNGQAESRCNPRDGASPQRRLSDDQRAAAVAIVPSATSGSRRAPSAAPTLIAPKTAPRAARPDGGYTASSAPRASAARAKSGMKSARAGRSRARRAPCRRRPCRRAATSTSTITSSPVRTTRIEWPRAASPVIRPSRGPGPKPGADVAPVATPLSEDAARRGRRSASQRVRRVDVRRARRSSSAPTSTTLLHRPDARPLAQRDPEEKHDDADEDRPRPDREPERPRQAPGGTRPTGRAPRPARTSSDELTP